MMNHALQSAEPPHVTEEDTTRWSANTSHPLQATNYFTLSQGLPLDVSASLGRGYDRCVAALLQSMREQFPALMQDGNPIAANLDWWDESDLRFIIQEYSGFSNAAIHMFLEARIRNHWPALRDEIDRNMDEELGVLTAGIPHLELMRYGYRVELGIETDDLQHTAATRDFIDRMIALFRSRDNIQLAGVLLAFEGTAVEEFRIVERVLHRFSQLSGTEIASTSLTGQYIAGHVVPGTVDPDNDPELSHYRGLVDAVAANIGDSDLRPLVRGFWSICLELNRWWEQLAFEALRRRIRRHLALNAPDPSEIYRTLRENFEA
jgi:hypothetical protein